MVDQNTHISKNQYAGGHFSLYPIIMLCLPIQILFFFILNHLSCVCVTIFLCSRLCIFKMVYAHFFFTTHWYFGWFVCSMTNSYCCIFLYHTYERIRKKKHFLFVYFERIVKSMRNTNNKSYLNMAISVLFDRLFLDFHEIYDIYYVYFDCILMIDTVFDFFSRINLNFLCFFFHFSHWIYINVFFFDVNHLSFNINSIYRCVHEITINLPQFFN